MRLRPSLVVGIGAVAGFVGIMTLVLGVFDGLLPANRLLGAVICSLLVVWGLLIVALARRGRP